MPSTIYRKYRPQVFKEVVGQDHITHTLQNEIIQNKLAHAYLFCGMRGVGKTTVARLLAKALNCEQRSSKQSEPCNKCESCISISSGRSLDLLEIDAASNRRIDDVREIREHIPYGPSISRYKVVIIDEVHMLTPEAFNALLKTLEEPPAHVVFILCTTEVHKLPETIISRCQRFDFVRITSIVLLERLAHIAKQEGVKIDSSVLKQIIELSGGSSRDAESYLGKLVSLGEKEITITQGALVLPRSDLSQSLDFVGYLIKGKASEAVELINNFLEQGGDLAYFYRQTLDLMRKILLIKLGGKMSTEANIELTPDHFNILTDYSQQITHLRLHKMLERWLKIEGSWRSTDIWQLPLELAAVEISMNGVEVIQDDKPTSEEKKVEPVSEVASFSDESLGLELSQVVSRWPEVVTSLRDYNHSLSFILSVAQPTKMDGKTLTIGFTYDLHLERVKDPKLVGVIEQSLEKVFGQKIRVKVVSDSNKPGQADLLSNVLNTFGGSIVN